MNRLPTFWFAAIASLFVVIGSAEVRPVPTPHSPSPKNGTIKGRVVAAESGLGLSKATITLLSQGGERGEPRIVKTNENGQYEVSGVKPGRYSVRASRSGYVMQLYGQKSPDAFSETTGTLLYVREDETLSEIDFRLLRGGAIEGRVVDSSGEPLARSRVQLSRYRTYEGKPRLESGFRSSTETDDRGHFRLFEISPGSYYLSARRDFTIQAAEGDRTATPATFYPSVLDPQEATRIEVGPGAEIQGLELVLLEVQGFDISGRVVSPQEKLDRDVDLWARRFGSDGNLSFFSANASVDSTGRFKLRNVIPGKYLITARSDDFSPTAVASGILSGRAEVEVTDSDVSGLAITIGRGGEITGKINWPENSPSVDPKSIYVRVSADGNPEGFYPGQMGEVGRDWGFHLKGISEGSIRFRIDLPSGPHYVESIRVDAKEVTDQTFEIHHNDQLQAVVTVSAKGAELNGAVKTENPEIGTEGVTVLALAERADLRLSSRFRRITQTDQNGRFALRGLAPGEYLVIAVANLEPGGHTDPDLQKKFEKLATRVQLEAGQTKSEILTALSTLR